MSRPVVQCPSCGAPVEWGPDRPWRPFCSERCKLVDLGAWAEGDRYIPGDPLYDGVPDAGDDPEQP